MVQFNLGVPLPIYIGSDEEAQELLVRLLDYVESDENNLIGADTETYGKKIPLKMTKAQKLSKNNPLDWMRDTITFWSLSAKLDGEYHRWCLPLQYLHTFIPLLENPKANIGFWNLKYDAHVLWNSGVYIWASNVMDGLVMGSLINENLQGQLSLKDVCRKKYPFFHPDQRFDSETYWGDLIADGVISEWHAIPMTKYKDLFPDKDEKGRKIEEFEYSLFDLYQRFPDEVSDYASLDAYACLRAIEYCMEILKAIPLYDESGESSLWEYYEAMEKDCTETLWRMERRGIPIDTTYLSELSTPMDKELKGLDRDINNLAGRVINVGSPDQLQHLFFGDPGEGGLGLYPLKMTKGGKSLPAPSTDKEVLDDISGGKAEYDHDKYGELLEEEMVELEERAVELARLIKRRRKVATIKSTFVDSCIKLADWHEDGRLHPKFNQYGARTGRFSTNNPNSQNMPRPDTDEFGVRKAFIAGPGMVLIVIDYGQLEMRIMAHFSQDKGMIQAITDGMDLHCFAVEKMYGIPYDKVKAAKKRSDEVKWDDLTEEEKDCLLKRQICKNTGFAIFYGAGAPRISAMLEIEIEEAEDILELYFKAFPGVKRFIDNTIAECRLDGYVTTLVGRRRNLPDIRSSNFSKQGHAEREACNSIIQGSAADMTKAAMLNIEYDEECQSYGVKLLNQIHDELVMECPAETAELAKPRIEHLTEYPFNGQSALCVHTPADAKIVHSWDQAK